MTSIKVSEAERSLRGRYGDPIVETSKMLAFRTRDGRELALDRTTASVQLWLESDNALRPPVATFRSYAAEEPRHSNLPPRLRHSSGDKGSHQSVIMARLTEEAELSALIAWYEKKKSLLNLAALEGLRHAFLSLHPDFTTFADTASFAKGEGSYKHLLTARAAELVTLHAYDDEQTLGAALLDLASGKGGLFSNLIDWRASGMIDEVRASSPGLVEAALGSMARKVDEPSAAVIACIDALWPAFIKDRPSKPYAESRMVPTMVMGLLRPDAMLGIRSTPTTNAHRMLLGRPAFAWDRLSAEELDSVLTMANEIFGIMRDEWHWKPRDLWDVQGFIWETCQKMFSAANAETEQPLSDLRSVPPMPSPTNLILYGPPGTGKTYTTAREAVRLCGEAVPGDRDALMALYRSLQQKGRIGFVTFHQNFAYEDFVEGLRPVTANESEGSGAGFTLEAQDGVFKQMAEIAASNHGRAVNPPPALDRSGKVFKMSLGRSWASEDDAIYQEAIRDGYVTLGWGGDIDWSDPRYDEWEAIKQRWRRDHPEASGNDPNMSQMYTFRINMEVGSLVVISDGNRKFRAIGEITGPYEYRPGHNGEYNHYRRARWLWHGESLPRERIYDKELSQVSAYQMNGRHLNWDGIEQTVASGGDAVATSGEPEPHVLIIDEINRANISKVFGELITLLEPDKRLGMPNALTVRLPYSKAEFGVPANLHIIGTMNTADRSIALLDTALRRRFTFREMAPEPQLLETVNGVDLEGVLTAINERIEYLVDREHRIGHAFFIHCRTRADVDATMRDKVIPLLQEYFFDDWSRIAAVVGPGFIRKTELKAPPGFGDMPPRPKWEVRGEFGADAYEDLMGGKEVTAMAAEGEDAPA